MYGLVLYRKKQIQSARFPCYFTKNLHFQIGLPKLLGGFYFSRPNSTGHRVLKALSEHMPYISKLYSDALKRYFHNPYCHLAQSMPKLTVQTLIFQADKRIVANSDRYYQYFIILGPVTIGYIVGILVCLWELVKSKTRSEDSSSQSESLSNYAQKRMETLRRQLSGFNYAIVGIRNQNTYYVIIKDE